MARPAGELLKTEVRFQSWPELGARETGLIVPEVSRWGTAITWEPGIGEPIGAPTEDEKAVRFFMGGDGPWAVYFPSKGEGVNYLAGWRVPLPGGGETHYDAAMHTGDGAALEEVEVNGGRGAPASYLHFVITGEKVIADVGPVLDAARAAWERYVGDEEPAVEKALDAARAAAPPPLGPETHRIDEGYAPTWIDQHVRVLYVRHVVYSSSKTERKTVVVHCPRGAPCMPPHDEDVTTEHHYGIELGLELAYDLQGNLISETRFEPAAL